MNLKKLKFLVLFSLLIQQLFSQEIYIPYRDGNYWGICNQQAKIVIQPQFDDFEFTKSYEKTHEYIITSLNEYKGLIINGKEILKPKYTSIHEDDGFFYIRSDENVSHTDIILPNGKSIFEKPIAKILYFGRFEGSLVVYHVLNPDLTESLFVYDTKNLKTVQYLYENYYSIVRLDKQSNAEQYSLLVKKTEKSDLVSDTWNMSKLPFTKNNLGISYLKEEEFLQFFLDKYYQNEWDKNSLRYGSNNNSVVAEDYEVADSYYGREEVVAVPQREKGSLELIAEMPVKVDIQYYFKKIEDKIFIESYSFRNSNNKKLEEINLSIPIKDVTIKSINYSVQRSNGVDYFHNYIQYQKGIKTVILFPDDLKNPIEFDFIGDKMYRIAENFSTKEIVFLVAKRDKNNQLKYGLYSNVRNQIVDFIYDELSEIDQPSSNGLTNFIAKQKDKFGVIQSDGKILLECNYAELKKKINDYRTDGQLFQIQNEDKYGFVYLGKKETKIVEPIFDYPIQGVISQFPYVKNHKILENNTNHNTMMLIELQDESNNFLGYANENGLYYFKN